MGYPYPAELSPSGRSQPGVPIRSFGHKVHSLIFSNLASAFSFWRGFDIPCQERQPPLVIFNVKANYHLPHYAQSGIYDKYRAKRDSGYSSHINDWAECYMKFTFLITEHCFTSGVVGLLDAFTIANLWQQELTGDREQLFTTELVSIDGGPITSSGCIELKTHKSITETEKPEFIIVPPVFPSAKLGHQVTQNVKNWLVENNRHSVPIAAICTGSFLLAETGLLDDRMATTNWQFARKFQQLFPKVKLRPELILTEEDGLICTGAATAYLNLGLSLIRRYGSEELANVCAKALLIDPNRTSQAPYFLERRAEKHTDAAIEKAQRLMRQKFSKIQTIDEIADHVGISSRHFKRRFKQAAGCSPLTYLQNIRIEFAKKKLESTLDSIDDITLQIGYENASTFRRLFKTRTSLSPREYRDKFSRKND